MAGVAVTGIGFGGAFPTLVTWTLRVSLRVGLGEEWLSSWWLLVACKVNMESA